MSTTRTYQALVLSSATSFARAGRGRRTPPKAKRRARSAAPAPRAAKTPLSPRELELLGLLASATATDDIAKAMDISEKTVRTHVQNILRKMKMRSRVEVVVWAYKTGLARP